MESPEFSQADLDRIAEEFAGALRCDSQVSVEEFLTRYPDASGQLAELLSSIAMIEGLKQQSGLGSGQARKASIECEQLDDYTLLREIGRGGMGIVFEAIHQSLGRKVAVKILANDRLGESKYLARFRTEARAAARLQHTNIVPVFGVGHANNLHYYVMDFIDGLSLREQISRQLGKRGNQPTTVAETARTAAAFKGTGSSEDPLQLVDPSPPMPQSSQPPGPLPDAGEAIAINTPEYFRWVTSLGVSICDALQYAHSRGVMHRDIKPANLLLDRRGVVWIADFGLAKLAEQQSVTLTGDVVGTPQYMPPESFDGSYDARSEVYCVGLTLYELLLMRPAIEGRNTAEVIRKAIAGVSIRARTVNPRVPRDLETVVHKALSLDPSRRYQSAGEMHDDLRRCMAGVPVLARRTRLIERAILWSRREPRVAALTFASFALLACLALVAATGYFQTKSALGLAKVANGRASRSLEIKTQALATADQQRQRAEKNLQVALTAFDGIMQNITARGIQIDAEVLGEVTDTTAANVTPQDARLLQSLLVFFDELAANNSEELLAESARAAQRAGDIYASLGQLEQAAAAYGDASMRYAKLASSDVAAVILRAEVMNELATIASLRGQILEANALFEDTLKLLDESQAAMARADGKFQYAKANRLFASLGSRSGLVGLQPNVPRSRRPHLNRFSIRGEQDLQAVEKAIEVLSELVDLTPESIRYRAELARAYRNKAEVAVRGRSKGSAESAMRRSIEMLEELLAENESSDAVRYELAMTLVSIEAFGFNQMVRATRAHELSRRLLRNSPTLPRYIALSASSFENLAGLRVRAGHYAAAERDLLEAVGSYTTLLDTSPELLVYQTRRAQALESLSDLKARQGQSDAAIEALEQAIQGLQAGQRGQQRFSVTRLQLQRMRQKIDRLTANSTPDAAQAADSP